MANRTDVTAIKSFGSNPQYLISNIIRSKIYESRYWKENCFALTSESIIDQAINLKYVGGTFGGNRKPTRFLCLILKLLQIQPDKDIIYEYIKNEEFIYLRALGIFYLRLIGKSLEIYKHLEPILFDYRKIRMRLADGKFQKIHMDEFVDNCLILNNFLDVDFPTLTKRQILEENNLLEKRNLEYYKELLNISSDNELLQNEKDNKESNYKYDDKFHKNYTDSDKDDDSIKIGKKEKKEEKRDSKKEIRRKNKEKEVKKDKIRKKKKKKYSYHDYEKKRHSSESQNTYSNTDSDEYHKKEKNKYKDRDTHERKKKKKEKYLNTKKDQKNDIYKKKEYLSLKKKSKDMKPSRKSDISDDDNYTKRNINYKNDDSVFDENKKEEMSINQWNKIRKELGLKPLK